MDPTTTNSRTTCDYAKGTVKTGDACGGNWDCMEKHICNGGTCKRVCVPGVTEPTVSCSNDNATCEKLGDQFGYCTF